MKKHSFAVTLLLVVLLGSNVPVPTAAQEAIPVFEPTDCPFIVPEGQTVTCGYVAVPEDHNTPGGPTIRLAVAVFKDEEGETHQPDPVILLCGGPGERCAANAPRLAQVFAPLAPNRDFIVFDQRGVGLSEPALECPEFLQASLDTLDEPDANAAAQARFDAFMACRDRLVSEGHNLAAYTNVQNAADVDAIRVALGYEQVNLLGGSYGSLLAQHVMRDYPAGIRSVVIASVLPLEKSLWVDVPMTAVNDILRLVDACAADEACNGAYPDLENTLFEVIDQLNAEPVLLTVTNPVDGQSYDVLLSGDRVVSNLTIFLYVTEMLPVLPQAIFDMSGGDYELMTQLTGISLSLFDLVSRGVMPSVMCTDDLIGRTPEDLLAVLDSVPEPLRGQTDPEITIEYGIFGICAGWPVEEADPSIKAPLVSDIPTLALGGEFDPVTPSEYAELVASYLENGYYFEFPGVAHGLGSLAIDPCSRSLITAFLDDPTTPPDASCVAEMPEVAFDLPVEGSDAITLAPFTVEERGFSSVAPEEWTEVAPGVYARQETAIDQAALVFDSAPDESDPGAVIANIAGSLGVETPEKLGERAANELVWSLYEFSAQGVTVAVAIAPVGNGSHVVALQAWSEDFTALYDKVYLPAIDAFAVEE
ncbi:MAG: alpha/beta fold hydrolase [Anaerolineae bacterium]|nr:alpha/beta fold hydrolase [Anaerolineae bacterium]